jgi:ankyrin repeat protein
MKLLATALFIVVCFGLNEVCAQQLSSVRSRGFQLKAGNSKRMIQPGRSNQQADAYCPDKNERGRICGDNELRAGSCSVLMVASEDGNLTAVRGLLEKHTDVNAKGPGGHTPLTLAAAAGQLAVVKALLGAGADPNVRGTGFHFGEFSVLMSAMNRCNDNWIEIMDVLIAAGAEVNPKGSFSRSPLMYAVELKNLVMIEALLARGADVNLKNALGVTALMTETMSSAPSPRTVRLLLSAGADSKARNNEGDTALTLLGKHAKGKSERTEIARLLKHAMAVK